MYKLKRAFLFLSIFIFSQNIALAEDKIILDENFTDNANKWYQGKSDNYEVKINNDKYFLDYKRTGTLRGVELKEIAVDQSKNFKIDTSIKKISGLDNDSYDLIWGYKDKDNFYSFGISGNGKYQIGNRYNGKNRIIIKPTKNDKINKKNAENKIVISKEDKDYNFYINGSLVETIPFQKFYGNKIGFAVNTQMKVEIENIKITQNDTSTSETFEVTILEPKVIKSATTKKSGLRGFEVVNKADLVKVKGITQDKNISELIINGTSVKPSANGEFTAMVKIDKSTKSLNIKTKDNKNNIKDGTFIIQ